MIKHFIKRLVAIPVTMLIIIFVVMAASSTLPGSQDKGVGSYTEYVSDVMLHGDFGTVIRGVNTREYLSTRFNTTIMLTLVSLLISTLIGVPAGIAAAVNRNKIPDYVINILTFLLYSIPPFIQAICLTFTLSVKLRLLPVSGTTTLKHYIMPIIILSCGGLATMTRSVRSATIEILGKQYIRVHRAKGLSRHCILYKHVLMNAAPAILAAVNNIMVQVMCGTLIVENFYGVRGMGYSIIDSISTRNQRLLLACVICLSIIILCAGYVLDLAAALISPKVRAGLTSKKGN